MWLAINSRSRSAYTNVSKKIRSGYQSSIWDNPKVIQILNPEQSDPELSNCRCPLSPFGCIVIENIINESRDIYLTTEEISLFPSYKIQNCSSVSPHSNET